MAFVLSIFLAVPVVGVIALMWAGADLLFGTNTFGPDQFRGLLYVVSGGFGAAALVLASIFD